MAWRRGFASKICVLCVRVIINERSFEPFSVWISVLGELVYGTVAVWAIVEAFDSSRRTVRMQGYCTGSRPVVKDLGGYRCGLCAHTHTHTHAHARTHTRARAHTCTHARSHTPARTHARTHAHTHTDRYSDLFLVHFNTYSKYFAAAILAVV